MAVVRKWDGVGVSNGTLGSSVGTGDNAFDGSLEDPTIAGECIVKASNTQHRWSWTGLNLGAVAIRFYVTLRSGPSGTSTLMEARDGSNRIFGLSINTSLQVALRNSSNSAVATSTALTLGRLYCIDLWKSSGNTTVQARIQDVVTGVDITLSGSPGSASNVTVVEFGQMSGTNSGTQRYSHMRVDDTAARIGLYTPIAGDFDTAWTRYGSTSSSSSHSVPLPDTQWGDLLIMVARSGSSTAPGVPTGWQEGVGDATVGERVMWRFATGSEPENQVVTISGGAHLCAVVYRIRSSVSITGVGTTTSTFDPPSLSTSPDWSGERNMWIYTGTWLNSNGYPSVMPDAIDTYIPMLSGSAAGRPGVVLGERRWTGDTLNVGAPAASVGTTTSQRASVLVVKFDTPSEQPEQSPIEWFIWDGNALEEVEALGAYVEGA